jgi:hypothetical protein
MENNQYRTIEWLNKRKSVFKRDNYTCQNCGTFDPSSGTVNVFNKEENDIELHEYNSGSSDYILTSTKHGITLTIEFGWGTWLVTPILQVHHKKYIKDLMIWEYQDTDLITLCKSCHIETHKNNTINIFSRNGLLIESKLIEPKDLHYRKTHNYKPWTFVTKIGQEYSITSAYPSVSSLFIEEEIDKIEELQIIARKMVESFFMRFLPEYKSEIEIS